MPSTTISVSLSQLPARYTALGPRMRKAAARGALAGAMRAVVHLQQETGRAAPANPSGIGSGGAVNTGYYKRSWKWQRIPDGARVYNAAPYASIVEEGRRAGRFPPMRYIAQWARRRLGLSEAEAKAAAFPIARAIAARGLLPRQVLGGSLKTLRRLFMREVIAELDKELLQGRGRP